MCKYNKEQMDRGHHSLLLLPLCVTKRIFKKDVNKSPKPQPLVRMEEKHAASRRARHTAREPALPKSVGTHHLCSTVLSEGERESGWGGCTDPGSQNPTF